MVDHMMDRQIFERNKIKPIDEATAFLMRKVGTTIGKTLMYPRHNPPAFSALRCAFGSRRQLALRALQILLVDAQELRTGRTLARREGREMQQAHVNAYGLARSWPWRCFHVTGYRDIPLASRRATDGTRFRCAFQRAMLGNPECSHFRQLQDTIGHLTTIAVLGEGHRIVAANPTEARIPCLVRSRFAPTNVCLEGEINPQHHILQDVRMHVAECGAVRLELWQGRLLAVVRQRRLPFLPSTLPFRKKVVGQTPAFLKLVLQEARWLFWRVFTDRETTSPQVIDLQKKFCASGL